MGVGFYLTAFVIQNLVDSNLEEGLPLLRDWTNLLHTLFVQIREGLSALLYKKSLALGLRSISE